jgi:OOP family OmpA-OmpF porin
VDTDADGVFDEADRCAATPRGVAVGTDGCRVDSDGDGVFNEDDRCPATPRGDEVDARGCTVLFQPETANIVLEGVTFETSSAQLTSQARQVLDRVAESLVANPSIRVRVTGHTDSTGSRNYNTNLSQSRAEAVADYLAQRGVARARMQAQGFGPDRPVATNETVEGRLMNRRVELERID